ncbi:sodium/hydrogen exchanger 2 [Danio rerio]|uniref:Sodium/hydrogen exchanger n=1 Tax=Danio rerio TaxID=7955 RepID=A9XPA0_DANRE|nr:sodium/hydrogen exchanger 2 [Danio rerio]ABU68833.1 sodium hydrogen exchanger 2 [Danio rerio]|eukprot:NP_001107567.1 sodium/hydrogen exchanger 2 [Danio rerio]
MDDTAGTEADKTNPELFTLNYARIKIPFEITLWVLLASFAKIGFNVYHKITVWVPESCLLISLGFVVGGVMHAVRKEPPAVISSNVFFLYMLPPIILESGYFMPTRPFFENVGTVMWFAVVGTLWNTMGIGISLFAICQIEAFGVQDINLQENLLFAAILSAVEPVAVLSVFEDISINEQLYIVMFGECLFNDAVTVVLYNLFNHVAAMEVDEPAVIFMDIGGFFVVGLGGIFFGLLFGFLTAFTTRFTGKVREIEPLVIFMFSYMSYLIAELFALSSIMAILICTLSMKYYVEENVSQRSCTTIRHVIKMVGSVSETLIFFFLGVVSITTEHEWNWGYILFTLFFTLFWRFLGILVLTQIINPFRKIPFNFQDQFGLAYGGLRGALSFALAFTLPNSIPHRKLFITDTIAVIIFTVFIQGITIRPLLKLMNIRKTNRNLETINDEIHKRLMEHTVAGIEDLCGQWSHYRWKDMFMKFNNRFIRKILIRDNRPESSIVSLYKKLELRNALEILDTMSGDISAAPSLMSLYEERKNASKHKKFLPSDVENMHELLSKNMYKIRQRTVSYTNRHSLPNENIAKEILMRRHTTIRSSLRSGSFHATNSANTSHKFCSLPVGQSLNSGFPPGRFRHTDHIDAESETAYPSNRSTFRHQRRSSSKAGIPLRPLNDLREDNEPNEEMPNKMSHPRSKFRHSGHQTSRQYYGTSRNCRDTDFEEQQSSLSPHGWTEEPQNNSDVQHPLMRKPQ